MAPDGIMIVSLRSFRVRRNGGVGRVLVRACLRCEHSLVVHHAASRRPRLRRKDELGALALLRRDLAPVEQLQPCAFKCMRGSSQELRRVGRRGGCGRGGRGRERTVQPSHDRWPVELLARHRVVAQHEIEKCAWRQRDHAG